MHPYYRRNSDPRLRELERRYSVERTVESLRNLNIARRRAGQTFECAPRNMLEELVQSMISQLMMFGRVTETQFPCYKLEIHPGKAIDLDRDHENVGMLHMALRETLEAARDLGYIGLIDLGKPARPKKDYCDSCGEERFDIKQKLFDTTPMWLYTCLECGEEWDERVPVGEWPRAFLMCESILRPSGDPINTRLEVIADQWMRYEDPRSLTDPQYQRGSYPTKIVLVRRPGKVWIEGKLQNTQELYTTWKYYVPYEDIAPSMAHGRYDIHPLENAYIDYLTRLLKIDYNQADYELIY